MRAGSAPRPARTPRPARLRRASTACATSRNETTNSGGKSSLARGSRQDLFDNPRLGVGVILDVGPLPLPQLPLRTRIEVAVCIVSAQPVTEQQHAADFGAAAREHVQIDRSIGTLEQPVLVPRGLADVE